MGEYAKRIGTGESVKIGTCEDMLYLRADQRHLVWAQAGNVDPIRDAESIRFRFPWPDEDTIEPGAFDDPFRRLRVEVTPPEGFEHGIVQFVAQREGYNVCLPCPEGPSEHGLTVHRNGFAGGTFLVQQKFFEGRLIGIFECVCGLRWRAETLDMAAAAIEGLLAEADRLDHLRSIDQRFSVEDGPDPQAKFLTEVALRLGAGYRVEVTA